MQPYYISVLGDVLLLFSLPHESEIKNALAKGDRCVILLPSLVADFRILGYEKCGKPLHDYYSAAVCAAMHLTERSGLPLSEISFETPQGIVEILRTGDGLFCVKVNKCKQLLSKTVEIRGCETDVLDVDVGGKIRVVPTLDVARFDKATSARLSSAALPLPSAVVLSARVGQRLLVRAYTDYNPTPPSSMLTFAAAAYSECSLSGCNHLYFDDFSFCRVRYSTVEIAVKPNFITENNAV